MTLRWLVAPEQGKQVVIADSEAAATALAALGHATGWWTPSPEPLDALQGRSVILWPSAASDTLDALGVRLIGVAATLRAVVMNGDASAHDPASYSDTTALRQYANSRLRDWLPPPDTGPDIAPPDLPPIEHPAAEPTAGRTPATPKRGTKGSGSPALATADPPPSATLIDFATRRPKDPGWDDLVIKGDSGAPRANVAKNIQLYLENHPDFVGLLAHNEFDGFTYLTRMPPWPTRSTEFPARMQEQDIARLQAALDTYYLFAKKPTLIDCVEAVAYTNSFHPLKEYLDGLVWDGISRLAGGSNDGELIPCMATVYFGAEDNRISAAFWQKWMIAAVARVYRPGCKMDELLIIEGEQGSGKSTALRILGEAPGPGYFTDSLSDIGSKDNKQELQGVWLIEISEFGQLGTADQRAAKAWASRQTERFRPPFGRLVMDFPRQCIFAATINPEGGGYLKDQTGGRRYWPTKTGEIDKAALLRDRDQLWAEAVALFKKGVAWHLTPHEFDDAREVQAARYQDDDLAEMIDDAVADVDRVVLDYFIEKVLKIPRDQWSKWSHGGLTIKRRVSKHLQQRGWTYDKPFQWTHPDTRVTKLHRGYTRPSGKRRRGGEED